MAKHLAVLNRLYSVSIGGKLRNYCTPLELYQECTTSYSSLPLVGQVGLCLFTNHLGMVTTIQYGVF